MSPLSIVALDEGQMSNLHTWDICDCIILSRRKCPDNNSIVTYAWFVAARHGTALDVQLYHSYHSSLIFQASIGPAAYCADGKERLPYRILSA